MCLSDPQSYISGSLALLAGPTNLNRTVGAEARLEYAHMQTLEVGKRLPSGLGVKRASTHYDNHGLLGQHFLWFYLSLV